MDRRTFTTALAVGGTVGAAPRQPRILLRSSWQTINIGDIGHSPGVMTLLEKYWPEAEFRLWPGNIGDGVREMLLRRFPKLTFVEGAEAEKRAFAECDFLLHGSGPYLVAPAHVERWVKDTGKPYGVYGITLNPDKIDAQVTRLLTGARFVFFRDSVSLQFAKDAGVKSPVMEFGPDGAFGADLRNDAAAKAFLLAHGLAAGQFLCCIPKYRRTPEWRIARKNKPVDREAEARNAAMQEHDQAPLREAVIAITPETPMKVLLCPEDETQMVLAKEMIYDKLPDAARKKTVWREKFWLTDEALSTYTMSAGLFGNEMHSPILCVGNGIPAIVCRFREQTTKGFMWRDIGLGDWLFDLDNEADVARVAPAALAMAENPAAARAKAAKARAFVVARQKHTIDVLKKQWS